MIMETRAVNTLTLLDLQKIKNKRKYSKMCKYLTKLVLKHHKNAKKRGEYEIVLMRTNKNSYLIKSGNYGFVVGLKRIEDYK